MTLTKYPGSRLDVSHYDFNVTTYVVAHYGLCFSSYDYYHVLLIVVPIPQIPMYLSTFTELQSHDLIPSTNCCQLQADPRKNSMRKHPGKINY